MTSTQKLLIAIHIISAIAVVAIYSLFLQEPLFDKYAMNLVLLFVGTGTLIGLRYRNRMEGLLQVYFVGLAVLTIGYLGLWLVLGLLMVHR